MVFRFGDFELDETGRDLRLCGRSIDVQPKVFDLLAYLIRHAGRVVPKDELMDQLWPNVHVTEASLQRAVSLLRRTLKDGELDGALKGFVGRGYRFAVDQPELTSVLPGKGREHAAKARKAAAARNWAGTIESLRDADQRDLSADDLELWAFALECLGRSGEAIPLLQKAVERNEIDGQLPCAAQCAGTLAKLHLERGEAAVARGWLARAASLLRDGSGEARAYLLWMQSRMKAFEGQPEEALALAQKALDAAEQSGSARLRALALGYVGFYNLSLGRARMGAEQQDHAAALAMSSSTDPVTGGLIYCSILWSCRCFADWSRANQWVDGFETWCNANFAGISASCELHRAEVVGAQGALGEALSGVNAALARLPAAEPWALGDAHRVRGDIHAALGDAEAARKDYDKARELGWDAEPGNALLLFDSGDADGAVAALDRALADDTWFGLQRRGWILANKARICALSGRGDEAEACLRALAETFDGWPSPAVRALAQEARAMLALQQGLRDPSPIQLMNLARQLWTSLGAEHHAARVRLALARIMAASGDSAGALAEARCAESGASRIGARLLQENARSVVRSISVAG
jgi:DNA-binding winged helix-turn-helix (wHTH) protein/ATP/maltotriose-dependent transcriptional regulator MalT